MKYSIFIYYIIMIVIIMFYFIMSQLNNVKDADKINKIIKNVQKCLLLSAILM